MDADEFIARKKAKLEKKLAARKGESGDELTDSAPADVEPAITPAPSGTPSADPEPATPSAATQPGGASGPATGAAAAATPSPTPVPAASAPPSVAPTGPPGPAPAAKPSPALPDRTEPEGLPPVVIFGGLGVGILLLLVFAFSSGKPKDATDTAGGPPPAVEPTDEPPGVEPTDEPPGVEPTDEPPGVEPTDEPPGVEPTDEPPGVEPTDEPPGVEPTDEPPGVEPVDEPPGVEPTDTPGVEPTDTPGVEPTDTPGVEPTDKPPGVEPTDKPPGVEPTDEPPGVEPTDEPPVVPDPVQIRHGAASAPLAALSAEGGKIVITWAPGSQNRFVVLEYQVERQVVGTAEWTTISPILVDTTFTDTKVDADTRYRYRVVSLATVDYDDPVVAAVPGGLTLPPGQARRTSAASAAVETAGGTYLVPTSVQVVTDEQAIKNPDLKPFAYVKVYVWDATTRSFLSKGFQVFVGQTIGKPTKVKKRTIDFSTGATLLAVELTTRKHPKLGHDEQLQVIRVKHADGREESFNDKDVPEAVKKKKGS